jgi:hypothetical protein
MGFFGASPAMIREILKRLWPAAAFSLAGYLIAIFIPSINGDAKLLGAGGLVCLPLIMPIAVSVLILRFHRKAELATSNSSLLAAGQNMINSCFASGLALVMLPVLATWAMCLVITISHRQPLSFIPSIESFLAISCLALLVYSFSFFSGVITASAPTHVASLFMLFVVPFEVLCVTVMICERFFLGFNADGFALRAGQFLETPLFLAVAIAYPPVVDIMGAEMFTDLLAKAVAGSVALFALSSFASALKPFWKGCGLAKLALAETAFCVSVAFVCSGLMLLFFIDEMSNAALAGASLIFLAGFIISRMAAKKTVRIWNRDTFTKLFLSVAAVALFFAAFAFGAARWLPKAANVKSAKVDFGHDFTSGIAAKREFEFSDPKNLEEILDYCKMIQDEEAELRKLIQAYMDPIKIEIILSSGDGISRMWKLPGSYLGASQIKSLMDSREFKSQNAAAALDYSKIRIRNSVSYSLSYEQALNAQEAESFALAISKDLESQSFSGARSPARPIAYATADRTDGFQYIITILPHFLNSVSWLKANGCYERLLEWTNQMDKIEIYRADKYNGAGPEDMIAKITSKDEIRRCIESSEESGEYIAVASSSQHNKKETLYFSQDSLYLQDLLSGLNGKQRNGRAGK